MKPLSFEENAGVDWKESMGGGGTPQGKTVIVHPKEKKKKKMPEHMTGKSYSRERNRRTEKEKTYIKRTTKQVRLKGQTTFVI